MKSAAPCDNICQIRRVTWTGLAVNLGLSAVKFIVGWLGSSQAVIADAVHSLSDMSTDLAVLFGVKIWSAPPDANHPYGHRRMEALVTTVIGLILAGVAVLMGYHALATTRDLDIQKTGWIAISGPFLSILLKEWLYRWTVKVGRQVKSSAVIANAWHHRSDAFSSIPALMAVGAASFNPGLAFLDHIGAMLISLFILKVSWDILYPALAELTDQGASEKDHALISEIAMSVDGVREAHAIRTRKFGSHIHVDMHILVDPDMTVRKGHQISEDVKIALIDQGPEVMDVVVHLEPYES
ncbi:cation transporter [bacterium]|nr:cation transporter [bacterium]